MNNGFPHSCLFCKDYYPDNDSKDIMKGGGKCWKWHKLSVGEVTENTCINFKQVNNKCIAHKSTYAIDVGINDDNIMEVSFSDLFLHANLVKLKCSGGINVGLEDMRNRLGQILAHLNGCRKHMSKFVHTRHSELMCKKGDNECIDNPMSEVRKRFNIIIRGFGKNTQTLHRFYLKKDDTQQCVHLRVYNFDDEPHMTALSSATMSDFVGIEEFCKSSELNDELMMLIKSEFDDYSKFLRMIIKRIK